MRVKWQGYLSSLLSMPGGGPQGCLLGLLEYLANSNDNADHVPVDMRFKFIDDLSILEVLNLILTGLSSYNSKTHVPCDVGPDQNYLPSANTKSQMYLEQIQSWKTANKMKLNTTKTKAMIFNFNKNHQFSTRLHLENNLLEIIPETKLLGTLITSDLKWHKNTEMMTKKAYKRMIILHKLSSFDVPQDDLVTIYVLYIRSMLELNCQVWHYSLTHEDTLLLERVQKTALRIIYKEEYESYQNALFLSNLKTLKERRNDLYLKFAKKGTRLPSASRMFLLNQTSSYNLRQQEKFFVQPANTDRLKFSSIPQLQRALNQTNS